MRLVAGGCTLVLAAWAGAPAPAPAFSTATGVQQPAPGAVVTDTFWSQALGTRKRLMLWLPPSYTSQPARRYPVAYYLHGAQGDENNWLVLGRIASMLDSLVTTGMPEMIVVMPDGDDGFYTTWNFLGDWAGCRRGRPPNAEPADSYCVPWPHYDEYIARDLVAFIDRRYRTLADRRHRGIAGLSMGGYGAMALANAYPDVFSAAASHSGVVSPALGDGKFAVLRTRFDVDSLRAAYPGWLWPMVEAAFGKDSIGWAARDPATLAARLHRRNPQLMPALYVDCGTEDFLLAQNRAFRDAVQGNTIAITYVEHAGSHTWEYWRRHAPEGTAWLAARLAVP